MVTGTNMKTNISNKWTIVRLLELQPVRVGAERSQGTHATYRLSVFGAEKLLPIWQPLIRFLATRLYRLMCLYECCNILEQCLFKTLHTAFLASKSTALLRTHLVPHMKRYSCKLDGNPFGSFGGEKSRQTGGHVQYYMITLCNHAEHKQWCPPPLPNTPNQTSLQTTKK